MVQIVMCAYREIIQLFPRFLLHPGIYRTGLFAADNFDTGVYLLSIQVTA